jgi:hypothetical protein
MKTENLQRRFFFIILIFLSIILIPIISAAHYITGVANDALNGYDANGRVITLWNYVNGLNNNLTDIIGVAGNSGVANIYLIDCELLENGCNIGDILTVKIFNDGSDYLSEERNVTVTGAGYDVVNNITINSPPEAIPLFPENFGNLSSGLINFNCSLIDLDNNLENVTFYGNWSPSGWGENETKNLSGDQDYVTFTKNLPQGVYEYGFRVFDNLSISNYSLNYSFTVDLTKPVISSILINETYTCGSSPSVRVNCTATDEILGVEKVIIQEISPSGTQNHSAIFLSGDTWYADITINETGTWKFNCIVNDSAGNEENLTSSEMYGYSSLPDLYINYTTIYLNNTSPIENETVLINATIKNLGCGDALNANIGFFDGNPDLGGLNLGNHTITIGNFNSNQANLTWKAQIGTHNLFVFADYWEEISEDNESNNEGNKTFSIGAWQEIFGNFSLNKTIGIQNLNLSKWFNESSFQGSIFIADSESNINWLSLQAIGKTISGTSSTDDFLEIDTLLDMQDFQDSVSIRFSNSQNPKQTDSFLIHQKNILGVPTINSSSDKTFVTGILWDYSDDIDSDEEYDAIDGEDIIFVTKLNASSFGDYGMYDYEIEIPVRLREYKTADSGQVYLYYDLN